MVLEIRRVGVWRREWNGWTNWRLDRICPIERVGEGRGSRPGSRRKSLDHQHRNLLRGFVARRAEFYHHAAQYAHPRHVFDADAVDLLGMVHDRGAGAAFVSGLIGRRNSIAVGSNRGNQLLYSRKLVCERCARSAAQWWLALTLAALV